MSRAPLGEDAARRLLNRIAYGPRPQDVPAVAQMTAADWIEAQLALPTGGSEVDAHLATLTIPIRYASGPGEQIVDEDRPLVTLGWTQEKRWALAQNRLAVAYQERERPYRELAAATMARKVVAPDQLRERLVEFWHDHFSVAWQAGPGVLVSLPDHDARIRQHAFGNFGALLEAMASSPAMLAYLNNSSSRAGAPNENYARELFELHTLGAAAYHPDARTWHDVPGAEAGEPVGYFDGDVWEAARALTGWTIAMGQRVDAARTLPETGAFTYVERWHDGYQKRVLGKELTPFAPALADGRAVLGFAATHPATARHVCGKLARFLLGDPAPPAAVARAEAAFLRHRASPDQIAQLLRALLDGPEVTDPAVFRVRRPLDIVAASARALAIPLVPRPPLTDGMTRAGQNLFAWFPPDGQPIDAAYYLGGGALMARWSLLLGLARNDWGTGTSPFYAEMAGRPVAEAAGRVATLALGSSAGPAVADRLMRAWAVDRRPDRLRNPQEAALLAGMTLLAPGFQQT
ncbi:DUF1800 domain-containing protein [Roseomonas sp. HJA6]|uniref:DUF1800 domain-containing protein n=1 Tax=Roseomonas alba TaxID=2846776 RepID=A0ABS7AEI4_9PROT|nr:DUF1800 domain-containing protein [Neoroseomonas alba]MBW6400470.1 DUF1800 domain-containing protein [Neoroseomonas alba]